MSGGDILTHHDALICDLDGVVYRGTDPVPYAIEALATVIGSGLPVMFATNNDTRTSEEIAVQLNGMGLPVYQRQIVTAPQVTAALIAQRYPPGTRVAVHGAATLSAVLHTAGMLVCDPGETPTVLVQGLTSLPNGVCLLVSALEMVDRWFVTNADLTVIRQSGPIPGNGTLVRELQALTHRSPIIAGKPAPHLLRVAAARAAARRPLVIGDQLDTDIAAARAAGMASLLVRTGLCSQAMIDNAPKWARPTYCAPDLRVLRRLFAAESCRVADG